MNKDGSTALLEAAAVGDKETVKLLLSSGADGAVCNAAGKCPLSVACEEGYSSIARMLIASRAPANVINPADGSTPLMWAAWHGLSETCKELLDAGAKLDVTSEGLTPAEWAESNGHTDVARWLMQRAHEQATASPVAGLHRPSRTVGKTGDAWVGSPRSDSSTVSSLAALSQSAARSLPLTNSSGPSGALAAAVASNNLPPYLPPLHGAGGAPRFSVVQAPGAAGAPSSGAQAAAAAALPGDPLWEWLQGPAVRLGEIFGALRELGVGEPADLVDMDDELMAGLRLKPIPLKRFQRAIKSLHRGTRRTASCLVQYSY